MNNSNRSYSNRGICALLLVIVLLISSCRRNNDPLIGRWTVEKVNVAFDENLASPEMVRQMGGMEKSNVIEITKDSVMTFISDGDTLKGRCALKGKQLTCEGKLFGTYEKGKIQTETQTPMGKMVVVYRKETE